MVFTGRLERWSRSEAASFVESIGGRSTSGVSSNTDYVAAGPDSGSKLEEAREREVPVLDEEDFVTLLEGRGVDIS